MTPISRLLSFSFPLSRRCKLKWRGLAPGSPSHGANSDRERPPQEINVGRGSVFSICFLKIMLLKAALYALGKLTTYCVSGTSHWGGFHPKRLSPAGHREGKVPAWCGSAARLANTSLGPAERAAEGLLYLHSPTPLSPPCTLARNDRETQHYNFSDLARMVFPKSDMPLTF